MAGRSTVVGSRHAGYRFEEEDTGRFALTRDPGGARLPVLGCVWRCAGPMDIDAAEGQLGLRATRIKEVILKKGYFLWPDDAQEAPES
jgi:hypothetical protein